MNGRPAPTAAEPCFPAWKAEAAAALAKLHERAAVAMRERDWRGHYVRGLSPEQAAEAAARDYAATHRPDWAAKLATVSDASDERRTARGLVHAPKR
jgi:hypothetical protein